METKQFAIIAKVDENASCPAAHLHGCKFTYERARAGFVALYDTLEHANADLFDRAQRDEDIPRACACAKTWPLFCANAARACRVNLAAGTDTDGRRHYHDDDVLSLHVVPVVYSEDGNADIRATACQPAY